MDDQKIKVPPSRSDEIGRQIVRSFAERTCFSRRDRSCEHIAFLSDEECKAIFSDLMTAYPAEYPIEWQLVDLALEANHD